MEYKANNHLLVSGDGKLSLPRRSECIRYLSSASLRKDSYIQIASEVIVCPINFANGNYLLNIYRVYTVNRIEGWSRLEAARGLKPASSLQFYVCKRDPSENWSRVEAAAWIHQNCRSQSTSRLQPCNFMLCKRDLIRLEGWSQVGRREQPMKMVVLICAHSFPLSATLKV